MRPLHAHDATVVGCRPPAILILIVATVFVPYATQRLWPLDSVIHKFGITEQYGWLEALLALGIYWIVIGASQQSPLRAIGAWPKPWFAVRSALVIGFAIFLCNFVLGLARHATLLTNSEFVDDFYQGWSIAKVTWYVAPLATMTVGAWLTAIVQVFLSPLAEELLYRGLLLRKLLGTYSASIAIVVSACVFALAHFDAAPWHAFFAGCILGYVYQRTGSLVLTILGHAMANLIAVLFNHGLTVHLQIPTSLWEVSVFLGMAAALLVAIALLIKRSVIAH